MLQSPMTMMMIRDQQNQTHQHQQSECCGCFGSEVPRLFLHNVHLRGTYHRLCTTCVLKHHSGSFCPVCFHIYGGLPPSPRPPPHQRLTCLHCPSISHLYCVAPPPPQYLCPPCSNPNSSSSSSSTSFDLGSLPIKNFKRSDGASALSTEAPPPEAAISKDLAKQLMAAARIASASMNKAASIARAEAERRAKEATLARNRAKEALNQLASLAANLEKPKAKIGSKPMAKEHQKKRSKLGDSVVAHKRIQNQIGTAVSGSPKNSVSVKGGKESNGLHLEKSTKHS